MRPSAKEPRVGAALEKFCKLGLSWCLHISFLALKKGFSKAVIGKINSDSNLLLFLKYFQW